MTHATPPPETDTSWLTKSFLLDALRNEDDQSGLTLEEIDVRLALGEGENYGSVVYRVIATFCDGGGGISKRSFIVKTLPARQLRQRFAVELLVFEKELFAYNSLLPAMTRLAESPLVFPQFFPTNRAATIVLEDIAARGFKMADRRIGLDLAHCVLALKTLAKFHGLSAELVRRDPSITQHFPETIHTERRREKHRSYLPNIYSYLADVVETWSGYEMYGKKIRSLKDSITEDIEKLMVPEETGFNVVNHGDFWVNNMMFKYSNETQEVEEVCLIDFQILRLGSPALDLQYFLATSPAEDIREKHEDFVLETYHSALIETIGSFGFCSSVYTLHQLKKEFADKILYGFHSVCTTLCAVVAEPKDAMDLDSVTEESIESKSANYLTKALRGDRFRETFKKILKLYEKKGFI